MNCIQPERAGGGDVEVAAVVGLDLVDRRQDLPADAVLDAGGLVDREQERRDPELVDEEVRDADRRGAGQRQREGRVVERRRAVEVAARVGDLVGALARLADALADLAVGRLGVGRAARPCSGRPGSASGPARDLGAFGVPGVPGTFGVPGLPGAGVGVPVGTPGIVGVGTGRSRQLGRRDRRRRGDRAEILDRAGRRGQRRKLRRGGRGALRDLDGVDQDLPGRKCHAHAMELRGGGAHEDDRVQRGRDQGGEKGASDHPGVAGTLSGVTAAHAMHNAGTGDLLR